MHTRRLLAKWLVGFLVAGLGMVCALSLADEGGQEKGVPALTARVGEVTPLDGAQLVAVEPGLRSVTYQWAQVTDPDIRDSIKSFECPTDWAEMYGTRVRGYLHPPATAKYTFWIASDDQSELWLSTNEKPEHTRKVGWVEEYTAPREWEKFPGQKSAPIRLEVKKTYYVEALQKEGGGGDNLAVAWSYGDKKRTVISGKCLSEYTDKGPGEKGSLSREVWRGIDGDRVSDLASSPRFPGAAVVELNDADKAVATFRPTVPGQYEFEFTVLSEGKPVGSARVWVLVLDDVLKNGGFEAGKGEQPEFWSTGGEATEVKFAWENKRGMNGSRCVSIEAKDPSKPTSAMFKQALWLAPYTAYVLRGHMKWEGLKASGGPGQCPACIGVSMWETENGPSGAKATVDSDWQPFAMDFATGPSGRVDVYGLLGFRGGKSVGKVYFDDLTLETNPDVRRLESRHWVMNLYRDKIADIPEEKITAWLDSLDRMYEAAYEFTGIRPGDGVKQSAWSPREWRISAGAWSGNPILMSPGWLDGEVRMFSDKGEWGFGLIHENGHNFDTPHSFGVEFTANIIATYVVEAANGACDGLKGNDFDKKWLYFPRDADQALTYRWIWFKQKFGWEPFRKAFHYFATHDSKTETTWELIDAWHRKISEFAGYDLWSLFTESEKEELKVGYSPETKVSVRLDKVPSDVRSVWLSDAEWESATVGQDSPHRDRAADWVIIVGEKFYPKGIFAHAPSRIVFSLGGKWKTFKSSYGLVKDHQGSVQFVVKGDGRELWRSKTIKDFGAHIVRVDVSGIKTLELVTEDAGDGNRNDWSAWPNARLER